MHDCIKYSNFCNGECIYSFLAPVSELVSRAARGHWSVESMHWHLDVTFREDANSTLDKIAAQNQNIVRKWALSILELIDINGRKMSLKRKRYNISMNPSKWLEQAFTL